MDVPSTDSLSLSSPQMYLGSPDPQNNISAKQPMSATLRERLRKMRRSFTSPCSVAKRLKIDCEESNVPSQCASNPSPPQDLQRASTAHTHTVISSADTRLSEHLPSVGASTPVTRRYTSQQDFLQEKRRLLKRIEEKEEILRRVKMVKLYRSKNNLTELQSLIEKWRKGSQLVLYELQTALTTENKKISLTHLIESYGLDEKLLHYNRTEEDFEDQ
ncbi:PREDICTED: swi5-dependent recombination DNA repair protein 1 homolog [Nanorana parkeri]|uniref:swi5-dependent recombination DNA repair protein 1 homolog n=1 Tax=Nanorana parkeri TaxID=125878 RepID=UPI0008546470|nr:PREDICTED: swi5-dependent recombination DNA repair protein 1 homolog [Nanorana parkeri]